MCRCPILVLAAVVAARGCALAQGAESSPCTAPTNLQELDARVAELRRQYEPFLRSLPVPVAVRGRTPLPRDWKFKYEAKDTPKEEAVPPAPPWHLVDLDDSQWETTTVPEWRYRTRKSDHALDPKIIDKWIGYNGTESSDTICWYRTTFKAEKPAAGRRLWLCFDGVDWEAQVYLNGELLGSHRVYYEPFRFDVTDKIQPANTLAVRVIDGQSYGEPMTYWAVFPDIRAEDQRYTPDRSRSIRGNLPIGYHNGTGFGIHRNVYLEQTASVTLSEVFARNDLSDGQAHVRVELDSAPAAAVDLRVQILPENFEGPACEKTFHCDVVKGASVRSLAIPMPDARAWSPQSPYLYRCRVTVQQAGQTTDTRDVIFGCRSFALVHHKETARTEPHAEPPSGMFMLNGKPAYLRGTNIQGLNCYAYWGQTDELVRTLLLAKAANFNAVRSCQHVEFPEVLEAMDRLGMMSEQDQGGGYRGRLPTGIRREQHIHTGTVLARQCYNHPGVVLLCFGNEHRFDPEPILRAALAVDPQRIFKPISGRPGGQPLKLPAELWPNVIDDGHTYSGWYGGVVPQTWRHLQLLRYPRMVTLGEYGAEALDAYETMRDHYPPQFKPPPPEADTLWAACQVEKQDLRQINGLGRKPANLSEYIEASQNYQEALLADKTIGMRLSPQSVAGYFQFHFIDVVPAFWPKSIVSHDHRPKKAYYQMAQINQSVVPLPRLLGDRPDRMELWVANDLPEALPGCTLEWNITRRKSGPVSGKARIDVPATSAVMAADVDLKAITVEASAFELKLRLVDAGGQRISSYQRQVRCAPETSR